MNNKIVLIGAKKDEASDIHQVIAAVIQAIPYYNDVAKNDEIQKFNASELKVKMEEDAYSVLLAKKNNQIVGFCLSRFDDYTIWLEWFGVVNGHRGSGIASLLLNKLAETTVLRQCHKIWCDCRTTNQAAIYILTTHGYRQLVTISNHWYGQDFILWEKPVSR